MTTPKTAAERKADQRKREAERLAALGHQVMPFEMYQRTAEALDRICAAGGFEQRAEVLTLLIHSADQIAQRDMSRFNELIAPLHLILPRPGGPPRRIPRSASRRSARHRQPGIGHQLLPPPRARPSASRHEAASETPLAVDALKGLNAKRFSDCPKGESCGFESRQALQWSLRCRKTDSRQLAHNRHWHCIIKHRFACRISEAVHSEKVAFCAGRLLLVADRCSRPSGASQQQLGPQPAEGITGSSVSEVSSEDRTERPTSRGIPLPLYPRAARRHPETIIMITLPIIGRSPAAVISRARMLGFECWPYRAERRANGTWVHYYRKADQKVQTRRTADNLLRTEGELSA